MHYMVDIEALGKHSDAVVVSVGIVSFNIYYGSLIDSKYWELELGPQQEKGRTIDSDTIMWWCHQTDEARLAIRNTTRISVDTFLTEWALFTKEKGFYWAKGTNYDFTILNDLSRHYNNGILIPGSKYCDARVIYNMAKWLNITKKGTNELPHNALADAIYQTQVVCEFYSKIKEALTCQKKK